MLMLYKTTDIVSEITIDTSNYKITAINPDDILWNNEYDLIKIYEPKNEQYVSLKFADKTHNINVKSLICSAKMNIIIPNNKLNNNVLSVKKLPLSNKYIMNDMIICEINNNTNTINIDNENIADLLMIILTTNIWISAIGIEENGFYLYTTLIVDNNAFQMKLHINRLSNTVYCFYEKMIENNAIELLKPNDNWTEEYYDIPNIDIMKLMNEDGFFAIYYYKSKNYWLQFPVLIYTLNGIIQEKIDITN